MSHTKELHNGIQNSEEYSKSSSKRLFESVFKIIDHDELEISSFDQADTNGSRITTMLRNQDFAAALLDKLTQEQLANLYPILKVRCVNSKGEPQMLDTCDLTSVFESFGGLHTVYSSQNQHIYYVLYFSFGAAFVAMKLMNNFSLRHTPAELHVQWCQAHDYCELGHLFGDYHTRVEWLCEQAAPKKDPAANSKQSKLTCRYDIQIENQKDFQVARRIIGSKGVNMKRIIQSALDQVGQRNSGNSNELLKLRLRGRGSGYKQGPEQLESEEELHLCISAKDEVVYNYACRSVQKLLQNVYSEYQEYTRRLGKAVNLGIKKSDLASQPSPANNENVMRNGESSQGRMEPSKIEQYLELRNKARRQLNFAEADRIRNYLRACGVCLIDQKGRRGKATEVTTWKYLA